MTGTDQTPREEFESQFGPVDDDQWEWLKEFVLRNPVTGGPRSAESESVPVKPTPRRRVGIVAATLRHFDAELSRQTDDRHTHVRTGEADFRDTRFFWIRAGEPDRVRGQSFDMVVYAPLWERDLTYEAVAELVANCQLATRSGAAQTRCEHGVRGVDCRETQFGCTDRPLGNTD